MTRNAICGVGGNRSSPLTRARAHASWILFRLKPQFNRLERFTPTDSCREAHRDLQSG
jgi:hypothetical protein